ncbi:MAG TPA: LysR family transcriptional regulator [Bryobacteraceae bacterium]|nr:LysR family transcriptional regulator [Bryobacteraceae bacterium]
MDIRQLQIFHAVLESGSMTRAADKMFLSAAAVSVQMRNLSRELGVELFVKSGKRLLPTPSAVRLGQTTMHLVDVLAQIRRDFAPGADQDEHPLVISTGITPLIYRLGEPVRRFRRQFPRANIALRVNSTRQTVTAIQEQQADAGIVVLPFEATGVQFTPLYDEAMKVCLLPGAAPVRNGVVQITDLVKIPFILYARATTSTRAIIDRFLAELGVELQVAVELDDTEAIKKLVQLGFGASILPEHALAQPLPDLQVVDIAGHPFSRRIAIATAETEYPRKLTQAFCQFLQAEIGQKCAPSNAR